MEVIGPVRVVHQYVNMPEQSAEFYNETTGTFEEVSAFSQPKKFSINDEFIWTFLTGARLPTSNGL